MQLTEAVLQALATLWGHKLRSFFTLLGIIVSVAFLIAVVAVIQGMNAYVRERLAGAIVGVNAFQIRRDPIQVGFIDDLAWSRIQRRPIIAPQDVPYVERGLPDAQAIAKKGTVLGQSWDGFVMLPLTTFEALYGRRQTTVISVKMAAAEQVAEAMLRAEEAMRIAHRLRPGQDDDFTVDTAEGLISFWQSLTRVIFTVVPAGAAIRILVGGIGVMDIMLRLGEHTSAL